MTHQQCFLHYLVVYYTTKLLIYKKYSKQMDLLDRIMKTMAPFAIGGISGAVATSIIQPIDTLKVQIQIISEQVGRSKTNSLSLYHIIRKIRSQQGLKVLYRGMGSAILRQLFYGSARIGSYDVMVAKLTQHKQANPGKLERAGLSFLSGIIGALIGNPFDVALIRRQASISDGRNPYKSTIQAFSSIVKSQGPLALWLGLNITIVKVVLLNFSQLAGRDYISEILEHYKIEEDKNLVAMTVAVLASLLSLPADNLKVKLQKQGSGEKFYKGIWDCAVKTIRREGILRLWVGLPIYLIRGAPHSFILVRTQMYLNSKWKNFSH